MTVSLKTLLEKAGEDINEGIKLVLPFSLAASSILTLFMPPLGTALNIVFIVAIQAENHFQGLPKSGPQKLAWALVLIEPALKEFVPAGTAVDEIVSGVADLLNKYDEHGVPIGAPNPTTA